MKKLVYVLPFLCTLTLINAQQASNGFLLSGEVVYQEIVKMDVQLEGVDPQIAEQIPKERKSEKVLYFTEEEAVFENLQKDDPEEAVHAEGSGMTIKMYQPDNKTYMDLKNNQVIEQKEFMSRVFLIESELEPEKWKMTGKQKKILEYACQEAITEVEGKDVHAWFTPEIEVATGPGPYCSLPGLVLAVEMNEGDMKLEAIGLELKALDKNVLKKPTKGKKVTRDEYQAIVAEKMKEIGVEGDGSGGGSNHAVVVRIRQ
jgi:GLPGLI family protein